MPFPPMHCSVAYLARWLRLGLSLPALLVGVMAPDLENPIIYVVTSGQYGRLVLHSLLGAVTLAPLLSAVLVVFAYPPVVSFLFRIDRAAAKVRCRFSWGLVGVCLAGNLSHVLIDALHHEYNPLFFPFTYSSVDALVLFNDSFLSSVVVQTTLLVLLILFVAKEARMDRKDIWKRLLVE